MDRPLREELMLDNSPLSVGHRSTIKRAAYLLTFMLNRAHEIGMNGKGKIGILYTQ